MIAPRFSHNLHDVPHGFFGRGSALDDPDDQKTAAGNRRAAADSLIVAAPIAINHQVHGVVCRVIDDNAFDPDARPQADALITCLPGVILAIHTADCAPVLFADSRSGVIGAAHAGWRGALDGVTDTTIAAMEALGADRTTICAAIGPCISRASYEVDTRFFAQFCAADAENMRFFIDGKPGHHHFDLESYVAYRLASAGIMRVSLLGVDTAATTEYWSHRRGTLSGRPEKGRHISMIGMRRASLHA